jgi:hypothetical protein
VSVSRNVEVLRGLSEQKVSYTTSHQKSLISSFVQSLDNFQGIFALRVLLKLGFDINQGK